MDSDEVLLPEHEHLYRIGLVVAKDHDLAEDAAAEGIVRALVTTKSRLERNEPPRKIEMHWYPVVIKNFIRDHYRKERRSQREPEEALQFVVDPADTPADRVEREEMLGAIAAEFSGLPEALRQALQLRVIERMPMTDVSAALQVPVSTLEKRVRRGLETLRERFERRHLAGGVSVAAAIRNSGTISKVETGALVTGLALPKLVASLLALVVGVGGLTWALLGTAPPEDRPADLVPPTRIAEAAEPDEAGPGGTPEAARREASLDSADSSAPAATTEDTAGDSPPVPPAPATDGETYAVTVRIRINGAPADDWIGAWAKFEPYAQPSSRSPRIFMTEPVEADATGAITYELPVEPRGEWEIALCPGDTFTDPANSRCYIHVHMDPQSALSPGPDGSRTIDLDVGLRSLTLEGGKQTYTPNDTDVTLVTDLAPGVWGLGGFGEEDTGDDMVFPEAFVGRARLCRIPEYNERTDPGGYPSVEPAWEGHIEPR